jgi:hypothetical protein
MELRDVLRRLRREVSRDALVIRQRDGTTRAFDKKDVMAEVYLAQLDTALGRPRRSSDVLDALDGATPESRRSVEEMCIGGFTAAPAPREATEPVEDLSPNELAP